MKRVKTSRFLMPRIQPVYGVWIDGVYRRQAHERPGPYIKFMRRIKRRLTRTGKCASC